MKTTLEINCVVAKSYFMYTLLDSRRKLEEMDRSLADTDITCNNAKHCPTASTGQRTYVISYQLCKKNAGSAGLVG